MRAREGEWEREKERKRERERERECERKRERENHFKKSVLNRRFFLKSYINSQNISLIQISPMVAFRKIENKGEKEAAHERERGREREIKTHVI